MSDKSLLAPKGIELVYVGNNYYQTTERMPDDSPSGSDYWSCYIPGVVTNKLGLVPEEHELYVLTIGNKDLLAKFLQHRLDRPELRREVELLEITLGYALFAFNDESITAEEMDLYREYVTDQILVSISTEEEIEKHERERIIAWGIEMCPHWSGEETRKVGVIKRDCSLCWQALKDG